MQLSLEFITENDDPAPAQPPAWESLEAAARLKALARLSLLIARMLQHAGASEREAGDE